MFEITMLPAGVGDALWIEYGSPDAPSRVLIDCGTSPTWKGTLRKRLEDLGEAARFELLIVTHVDTDHIGGVLPMFSAGLPNLRFDRVWFNAWRHLSPGAADIMGPVDGEILSVQLDRAKIPWNRGFRTRDRAARASGPGRKLPVRTLPGGLRLTLVAPTRTELDILRPKWKKVVEAAGLAPGTPSSKLVDKARKKGVKLDLLGDPVPGWAAYDPTELDETEANGSSIAVLAEYEEANGRTKRILLTGDAHGPVLEAGVRRLAAERGQSRLVVDAVKAPHHGSLHNVTSSLVSALESRLWLFSSSGSQHGHPHKEAVARVLVHGSKPTGLRFNYRTEINRIWDTPGRKKKYRYDTKYGDGTLTVAL